MEGTLRDAEQVAYYILEEGWFTRSLGSVALYRVSESLSLELDQETPTILGDSRNLKIDGLQLGEMERGRDRESDGEMETDTQATKKHIIKFPSKDIHGAHKRARYLFKNIQRRLSKYTRKNQIH